MTDTIEKNLEKLMSTESRLKKLIQTIQFDPKSSDAKGISVKSVEIKTFMYTSLLKSVQDLIDLQLKEKEIKKKSSDNQSKGRMKKLNKDDLLKKD